MSHPSRPPLGVSVGSFQIEPRPQPGGGLLIMNRADGGGLEWRGDPRQLVRELEAALAGVKLMLGGP